MTGLYLLAAAAFLSATLVSSLLRMKRLYALFGWILTFAATASGGIFLLMLFEASADRVPDVAFVVALFLCFIPIVLGLLLGLIVGRMMDRSDVR